MTPDEFVAALAGLAAREGWRGDGQSEAARLLGVTPGAVRRWVAASRGRPSGRAVPAPAALLVRLMERDRGVVPALRGMAEARRRAAGKGARCAATTG